MDPLHGFHRRLLSKRRGVGAVLDVLLGGSSTSDTLSQGTTNSGNSQGNENPLSQIVGGFSTFVDDMTSVLMPSPGPSATTISSASLVQTSSSSTGSTNGSASSAKTTSSTASTASSTLTPVTLATLTSTPISTPLSDTVYASSDGSGIVYITSTMPATSATAAPTTSFLQNPSLETGVFALVGVVVLIIICALVTWTIRRRRRDRLEKDVAAAVTFDPGATDRYEQQGDSIDKHRLSVGSSGHGYMYGYGYGYGMQPAYAPQQEYHVPLGYGQYPPAAYPAPPPNPAPYQASSPEVAQLDGQGGANLKRKFSDRKPVPPLLPNPAYDPSDTQVSIPPQFYQQ